MSGAEISAGPGRRTRRPRKTRKAVVLVDRITTAVIKVGGIAVIATVLGIMVYLTAVVWPLFRGAQVDQRAAFTLLDSSRLENLIEARVDEYRVMGSALTRSGELTVFEARTGKVLTQRQALAPSAAVTAEASYGDGRFALGLADGGVLLGRLDYSTSFLAPADISAAMRRLPAGGLLDDGESVIERSPQGEFRRVAATLELSPPLPIDGSNAAVTLIESRRNGDDTRLACFRNDGSLSIASVESREDMATGAQQLTTRVTPIPLPADRPAAEPAFVLLTAAGDQLYLAWPDGTTLRWELRGEAPVLAERVDLLPDAGTELTALAFMSGEQSLVAGDSRGGLFGWFRIRREGAGVDGFALVRAKEFEPSTSAIRSIAVSSRDKTFIAGDESGEIGVHYLTSEQQLARAALVPAGPIAALQLGSKNDAIFALARDGHAALYDLTNPHPGVTFKSIFGKVWYEGYSEPTYTWQSSSGTDDFEPKYSLIPLIFGTMKATLYALLFAVPVALGAAIYTSEFLDRRTRAVIKPAIEMMAALPSVVLGFVAALVMAPFVEHWTTGVVVAFVGVPAVALGFGYLWQALPARWTLRWEGWPRTIVMIVVVASGVVGLTRIGTLLERLMFDADFKGWLNGTHGTATPGLALMIWPLAMAAMVVADRRWIESRFSDLQRRIGRERTALLELSKYVALVALSMGLAALLASLGATLGLDPRGLLVGTYVQRNALIVGFTMGFAVIPIIYTISEDALTAVPTSLRSASLGCGATRWQTAIRVVLPVAVPGIFSALMVGLGRAVGETMIVLMAAGNTPLMSLNLFDGLRTLSANIAVELPEAVKGGTLYRMLFLAALTLLLMTFLINTVAEAIRLRFRKRTAAL
ncbi:MAG: ABC transporter permease subunit [Acidobacteriota bacterium]